MPDLPQVTPLHQLTTQLKYMTSIDAIKSLKFRFLQAASLNRWDELETLLTEDVQIEHPNPLFMFTNRDDLMAFLRATTSEKSSASIAPAGHCNRTAWPAAIPQIALTGEQTAVGHWSFEYRDVDWQAMRAKSVQTDQHSDEYRYLDGHWKIARTRYPGVIEPHWNTTPNPSATLTYS